VQSQYTATPRTPLGGAKLSQTSWLDSGEKKGRGKRREMEERKNEGRKGEGDKGEGRWKKGKGKERGKWKGEGKEGILCSCDFSGKTLIGKQR